MFMFGKTLVFTFLKFLAILRLLALKVQKPHVALSKIYFLKMNGHHVHCNLYNYVKACEISANTPL